MKKNNTWSKQSSEKIFKYFKNIKKKKISIILTGGKSAKNLYKNFYKYIDKKNKIINFYLTDERLNSRDLNSLMIQKFFLNKFNLLNFKFFKILDNKNLSVKKNIMNYSNILPKRPDIIILSVGDDGHIASLFPYSNFLDYALRVKKIFYKKSPIQYRITITSKVILSSKKIFVLCPTIKKKYIYNMLIMNNFKYDKKYPACILKKATWLI
jgi:6-phosphogluconolactonase